MTELASKIRYPERVFPTTKEAYKAMIFEGLSQLAVVIIPDRPTLEIEVGDNRIIKIEQPYENDESTRMARLAHAMISELSIDGGQEVILVPVPQDYKILEHPGFARSEHKLVFGHFR